MQKILYIPLIMCALGVLMTINSVKADASTYYVAGDIGNDSRTQIEATNPATPWQSITKAAEIASAGDTIYVKGGITYNQSKECYGMQMVICPTNSGTAGNYISYLPWPQTGRPIIDLQGKAIAFLAFQKSYLRFSGFEIKNEATWSGIYLYQAHHIILTNNIVHDMTAPLVYGIQVRESSQLQIYNNTIYNIPAGGIAISGNGSETEIAVKNNISYPQSVYVGTSGIQVSFTNNLANHFSGYDGFRDSIIADNIEGDPLLVDPTNGDYRLQPNSPAIDAGVDIEEVNKDIASVQRPQRNVSDIGAYEYYSSEELTLRIDQTISNTDGSVIIKGYASTTNGATLTDINYRIGGGIWNSIYLNADDGTIDDQSEFFTRHYAKLAFYGKK